ncbi:nitrite reductase/ring-hydroxylating ferredoxin subunit [Mucilaginibacter sp. UYNi724]
MRNIPALLIICLLFLGCGKTGNVVPNVKIAFSIPVTDPRIIALNAQGGAVFISGVGVAGIIIYRGAAGYVAYDRCSSYQPEKLCAVVADDNIFTVVDPCSGSKFLLSDGSPVKAPATRSLKAYAVSATPGQINVYN